MPRLTKLILRIELSEEYVVEERRARWEDRV